jgi:hypothetical protein
MKRLVLAGFLVLGVAALACAGSSTDKKKSEGSTPITKVPPQDDEDVDGKDKEWGGWRWRGKRDDCYFVHKNKCFDDEKKACKAAGCSLKECELEGGGPAKVSCPKKK